MSIQGLMKLDTWRRAKDFGLDIYRQVLPMLPPDEKWSLAQQFRRSSTSISANIAEGFGRFSYQENVRFCYYARGSLDECLSHLVFCHEMGFIQELEKKGEKIYRMLNGYISYLKKSKKGLSEPGASVMEPELEAIHNNDDTHVQTHSS